MKYIAVIDTNVIVSALLTSNTESSTVKLLNLIIEGKISPLFNSEIINEYKEVLHRSKFGFSDEQINSLLNVFKVQGIDTVKINSNAKLIDPKDVVFYEVSLSVEDAFLVTGNKKHFPIEPHIVSPAEMIEIINNSEG